MSRNRAVPATALAAILMLGAASPAFAGWPFGGGKSAPAAAAPAQTAKPEAKAEGPRKASAEERTQASQLDPLTRSVFWAHETQIDPSDARANVELASALRALGKYDEAIQTAGRVLVLDPKNVDALLETGRAHIGKNQGFYAIEPLRRAQAVNPRDWRPASLLGVAYDQAKRSDEALAAFNQALALAPNNPAVLSNLALYQAAHGQPAQAESLLRRAVAQPGATAQERQNLALVLGLQGKVAEAERLIREDLPPDAADANLAYLKAASMGRSWNSQLAGAPTVPNR